MVAKFAGVTFILTLVLLNPDISCVYNNVDPDQLASQEANWSGSALFVIQYMNLYQQSGWRNLIGLQLEVGVAPSLFSMLRVKLYSCNTLAENAI